MDDDAVHVKAGPAGPQVERVGALVQIINPAQTAPVPLVLISAVVTRPHGKVVLLPIRRPIHAPEDVTVGTIPGRTALAPNPDVVVVVVAALVVAGRVEFIVGPRRGERRNRASLQRNAAAAESAVGQITPRARHAQPRAVLVVAVGVMREVSAACVPSIRAHTVRTGRIGARGIIVLVALDDPEGVVGVVAPVAGLHVEKRILFGLNDDIVSVVVRAVVVVAVVPFVVGVVDLVAPTVIPAGFAPARTVIGGRNRAIGPVQGIEVAVWIHLPCHGFPASVAQRVELHRARFIVDDDGINVADILRLGGRLDWEVAETKELHKGHKNLPPDPHADAVRRARLLRAWQGGIP